MTPLERGINALLGLEETLCVRMHQAMTEKDRATAYTDAMNTRICINTFAKAYLGDDKAYKKFEKSMSDMHRTMYVTALNIGIDQMADIDETPEGGGR